MQDEANGHQPIPLPDYSRLPEAEMIARAEAFFGEIRRRHTVRDFSPEPVPRAIIESCIRAAGTAPSGANHQPWHFTVVSDPARKREIRLGAEQEEREFYAGKAGREWLEALKPLGTDSDKPFLEIAPWLIVVFGERSSTGPDGERRKNYYVPESVSIAVGFLLAGLHRAGLVTLTHTPSPMGFLGRICGRPESEKPYFLVVAGYPAPGATIPLHATRKKPLDEIATFL